MPAGFSGNLRRAAPNRPNDPVGMRKAGAFEHLDFAVDVVLDAPNLRLAVVDQEVRGPGIAVIRQPGASTVCESPIAYATDEWPVDMPEYDKFSIERGKR